MKTVQQRLDESARWGKERDALGARLKTRIQQLEEAAQKACREADEKEARMEREYEMTQHVSPRQRIKTCSREVKCFQPQGRAPVDLVFMSVQGRPDSVTCTFHHNSLRGVVNGIIPH